MTDTKRLVGYFSYFPSIDTWVQENDDAKDKDGVVPLYTASVADLNTATFNAFVAQLSDIAAKEATVRAAERYQVLRDPAYQMHEDDPYVSDASFNTFFEEELDKVVDALKARRDAVLALEKGTK